MMQHGAAEPDQRCADLLQATLEIAVDLRCGKM
jgi:hypothetical protein